MLINRCVGQYLKQTGRLDLSTFSLFFLSRLSNYLFYLVLKRSNIHENVISSQRNSVNISQSINRISHRSSNIDPSIYYISHRRDRSLPTTSTHEIHRGRRSTYDHSTTDHDQTPNDVHLSVLPRRSNT